VGQKRPTSSSSPSASLSSSSRWRLQAARTFEQGLNGQLMPEVTKNYELLSRVLVEHFRVLQEMGVEGRRDSTASVRPTSATPRPNDSALTKQPSNVDVGADIAG